jgi:hypothetical protein
MTRRGRLVVAGLCVGLVLACRACTSHAVEEPGAEGRTTVAPSDPVVGDSVPVAAAETSDAVEAPTAPAGYHRHRTGGLDDNQFVYVTDLYEKPSSPGAPGPMVLVTVESEAAGKAHRASLGLTKVGPGTGAREIFVGTHDDDSMPVAEVTDGGRAFFLTTNDGTSVAQLEAFARQLS